MTYDAGNRKQVRAKEKEADLADRNRQAYTKRIMSDAAGRKWMHDILVECHIFTSPFVLGAADATAWNIGKQDIGRRLFADVFECPTEYAMMIQEASIKEQVHDRRYSDDRTASVEQSGREDGGRDNQGPVTEYDPLAEDGDNAG